ncbi:MAG: hypothetical protein ACOYD3_03940 [Kiritimatiellia bacterium]|jgi:hypothetical protein
MSKHALELLNSVGFLDKNDDIVDLSRHKESELKKIIAYYANSRRKALEGEISQIDISKGLSSLVSSISAKSDVPTILPSMLVYDRLLVDDPLFRLHREDSDFLRANNKMLGLSMEENLEHKKVIDTLQFFKKLAPLMRHGMVFCLPLAGLHRPPTTKMAINYSNDCFKSAVPDVVHDFIHDNAIISEMQPAPDGKGFLILGREPNKPTRAIMVTFQRDNALSRHPFYLLHEMQPTAQLSDTRFAVTLNVPWDSPPNERDYRTWVYQSINKTIGHRLKAMSTEIAIAEKVGAVYTTESDFEAQLCGKLGLKDADHDAPADAVNFLRANEPRLRIDSAYSVLRLRLDNPQMFEQFQDTLIEVSSQLHGANDFDHKARRLLSTEIIPQVLEIETAAKKLRGAITGAVLETSTTIGLALLSGESLPFATVLGLGTAMTAAKSFPSVSEYLSVRKRPAFIWRQITRY